MTVFRRASYYRIQTFESLVTPVNERALLTGAAAAGAVGALSVSIVENISTNASVTLVGVSGTGAVEAPAAVGDTTPPGSNPGTINDLNVVVASETDTEVSVSWTIVDDGAGNPADTRLRYSANPPIVWGTSGATEVILDSSALGYAVTDLISYTWTGLVPGGDYEFQVRSYIIETQDEGALSNIAAATTSPTAYLVSEDGTDAIIEGRWPDHPDAVSYSMWITDPGNVIIGGPTAATSPQQITVPLDDAPITVDVSVNGKRSDNTIIPRTEILFTTVDLPAISVTPPTTVPADPTNLQATAVSSSRIDLSWSDNSDNEDSFRIQRKTGVGGIYGDLVPAQPKNTQTFSDSGLPAQTTFVYRIRAENSLGPSNYSNEAQATTSQSTGGAHPNEPPGMIQISDEPFSQFGTLETDSSGNPVRYRTSDNWTIRYNPGKTSIVNDPQRGNVLEFVLPAGHVGGSSAGNDAAKVTDNFPTQKEYYVHWWQKFSPNWVGHVTGTLKNLALFYKLPTRRQLCWIKLPFGSGTGPFSIQVKIAQMEGCGLGVRLINDNFNVVGGQWYENECYWKQPSAQCAADGIVRWWVDGDLKIDQSNVVMWEGPTTGILDNSSGEFIGFRFWPGYGGTGGTPIPAAQWLRYSDFYGSYR